MRAFQFVASLVLGLALFASVQAASDIDRKLFELAFDILDVDKSGHLTNSELLKLAQVTHPNITEEELQNLLNIDDKNNDKQLNKTEFVELLSQKFSEGKGLLKIFATKYNKNDNELSGHELLQFLLITHQTTPDVANILYNLIDKNADGFITQKELEELDPEHAKAIHAGDKDGDGKISREEFEQLLESNSSLKEDLVKHFIPDTSM